MSLGELHALALQSLYASLMSERIPPISAGTVLNLHLVLTQAFGQAVRWGFLDRSPAAGAQPPRPRRPEPAVIDAELASKILDGARGHALEVPIAIGDPFLYVERNGSRHVVLTSFELDRTETLSPTNPLGVKGVGETGTIASPAAVMNAVVDALQPYGVEDIQMPATPERVWRAIEAGRA